MFNSTVMDLIVGLIFTYFVMALIVSAITEGISSGFKWRSSTLLEGVADLLNDPSKTGLVAAIYNHALVSPRSPGNATDASTMANKPSYIDSEHFAGALIDTLNLAPGSVTSLQAAIAAAPALDPQLKQMLTGMVTRSGGNLLRVRDEIAAWFDAGMDRVGGVYKRKTQVWTFVLALALAGIMNVDTVNIATTLWRQPMLTQNIEVAKTPDPIDALHKFEKLGLPYGWDQATLQGRTEGGLWIIMAFGWLLTAIATLFGAPFWFDLLQQIAQLKGTGKAPAKA
jgi:hypothetical protein